MSKLVLQPSTLITPEIGTLEYDGRVPYFTPQGTQRGVIPGMQYYRLENTLTGVATTAAQSMFGVGVTLSANTVYHFEYGFILRNTVSATTHVVNFGFGGTATVNNILYQAIGIADGQTALDINSTAAESFRSTTVTLTEIGPAVGSATRTLNFKGGGTVSIAIGGTFIPQFNTSIAVGPYTTLAGSYFLIYPVGAAGSNTSVGTWA
jgi:hypothetical protein